MAGKRIYAPSILIDGVEFKCFARSVSLEAGDYADFCTQDWTFTAELMLGYGAADTWNLLYANANTTVEIVLKPEDDTVGPTNPSATFDFRMPTVSFMTGSERGARQSFTLTGMTETEPVFVSTGA